MSNLYANRIERAVAVMEQRGVDALLVGPGADMFYFTGFDHSHAGERLLAFVLRRDGSSSWISPTMNVAQIQPHAGSEQPIRGWADAETYLPALGDAVSGCGSVAFDDEARSAFLMDLQALAPAVKVSKSSSIVRGLRARKDAAELNAMRVAGAQVDEAIPKAIASCRMMRMEFEVERDLRAILGDGNVAFTIVAAGANTALPHHETGRSTLLPGDPVILDFGTRFQGYHSDITVTCCVSEPSDPEVRKVYRTVWEAQQKALEAIRPGVPCESIDRAAREHIAAAGYGEYFIHRTGHGLGLQVHEPPYMVEGNAELLEEGMTFSVEPGIYLPGRFGVRLEVIASVGSQGVDLINQPSARELPIAG